MPTVVVAHYNEDLTWLLPFAPRVVVVTKSPDDAVPEPLRDRAVRVPNLGLDQYCHLKYIVDNYHDLPDGGLVFTQAGLGDHLDVYEADRPPAHDARKVCDAPAPAAAPRSAAELLEALMRQVRLHGHTLNARAYVRPDGSYLAHPDMRIGDGEDERSTQATFGEWLRASGVLATGGQLPPPQQFAWFKNAVFGASKAHILSRPRAFYAGLLAQITRPRQDVLHYIERAWFYALNMHALALPASLDAALAAGASLFATLNRMIVESGQQLAEGSLFFAGAHDLSYNDAFRHKQLNLLNAARSADRILEIGFNAGHSAALMLLANPRSRILVFDMCQHAYTRRCYEFLRAAFGAHRFVDLVAGDSRETLPRYFEAAADRPTYDLIHIDGGHEELVAASDIINARNYAAPRAVVVVDDVTMPAVRRAVNLAVRRGVLSGEDGGHGLATDARGACGHLFTSYVPQTSWAAVRARSGTPGT